MELDRLDDLERRTRESMDDGRVLLAIDRLGEFGNGAQNCSGWMPRCRLRRACGAV
jgi:hypothetical protein